MSQKHKYSFKKILGGTIWTLLGCGTVILLVAAMKQKNNSRCRGIEIKIIGVQKNFFIDKNEIMRFLEKTEGKAQGRLITSFDLYRTEALLEKNEWIKNAELFFDNNENLIVNIVEREPVARIFTADGSSFYIDTTTKKLSLNEKFSARLPVFSNFPATDAASFKQDSILLTGIKNLGEYILRDPFWMAQIDQVNITAGNTFEIIPKIGNQLIIFGTAENFQEKFNKLLLFYNHVESKVGWNKYSQINVSFKGQVVAVKRDAEEVKMDSLRTIQLMKTLSANAQKLASDTVGSVQLVQPPDDFIPSAATNETIPDESTVVPGHIENTMVKIDTPISSHVPEKSLKPLLMPKRSNTLKTSQPPIFKSIEEPNPPFQKTIKAGTKKPAHKPKEKPKAVMQPKNDY